MSSGTNTRMYQRRTLSQFWCILAPSHDHVKHRGSSIPEHKRRRIVMEPIITPEIVVAYSQCPRKAYLLLFSPDKGEPHEYVQILEQQRRAHQERYTDHLQQTHADVQPYSVENLRKGSEVLINAHLQVDGLAADCGVLTRVEGTSTFGKYHYEPTICIGMH